MSKPTPELASNYNIYPLYIDDRVHSSQLVYDYECDYYLLVRHDADGKRVTSILDPNDPEACYQIVTVLTAALRPIGAQLKIKLEQKEQADAAS